MARASCLLTALPVFTTSPGRRAQREPRFARPWIAPPEAETLDYDEIYNGRSPWRLLPPIDNPDTPARCLITGTGLSHLKSAQTRDSMHTGAVTLTDSMKMYQWGVDGGKPAPGLVGAAPEWFYKGDGALYARKTSRSTCQNMRAMAARRRRSPVSTSLVPMAHRAAWALPLPTILRSRSRKLNYLYLAHSKLRACSLGPELVNNGPFDSVQGRVCILRGGSVFWERTFLTGEQNMCHSLAIWSTIISGPNNTGAPATSTCISSVRPRSVPATASHMQEGDVMEIAFEGYGRPTAESDSYCTESRTAAGSAAL